MEKINILTAYDSYLLYEKAHKNAITSHTDFDILQILETLSSHYKNRYFGVDELVFVCRCLLYVEGPGNIQRVLDEALLTEQVVFKKWEGWRTAPGKK